MIGMFLFYNFTSQLKQFGPETKQTKALLCDIYIFFIYLFIFIFLVEFCVILSFYIP